MSIQTRAQALELVRQEYLNQITKLVETDKMNIYDAHKVALKKAAAKLDKENNPLFKGEKFVREAQSTLNLLGSRLAEEIFNKEKIEIYKQNSPKANTEDTEETT